MEPAKRRRIFPMWQHFDLVSPNKVKCLLCAKELGYNNNTSSMLRHYRAFHEKSEENGVGPSQAVTKKGELDEALVSMIVKDTQPFSIVEDEGFREFVAKLDPSYVLPTRKAVKTMVEAKYQREKEKAKAEVEKVPAVSLTSDMWTSINMDAYLAVSCHFIDDHTRLQSTVLAVASFPQAHTAENLARVKSSIMEEWGITSKVTCLVTDGAANMIVCGRELKLRHAVCVAHSFNLIVKKAPDLTPVLSTIRTKARKLVGCFRSSTTAKEKVALVQEKMGLPKKKLLQEVETRWNSTFEMLQRLAELREPVGAALAGLQTDIPALTSEESATIVACLSMLAPFHEATTELSGDRHISGSIVVPLMKMVDRMLQEEAAKATVLVAKELGEHLIRLLRDKLSKVQSMSIMSLATLLDPRFKSLGFFSPTKAEEAVKKRLTSECSSIIGSRPTHSSSAADSTSQDAAAERPGNKLWSHLDSMVAESQKVNNATVNATVEVQRYLAEINLGRNEDPLQYWERQRCIYPNLYKLAIRYLCTPASSVPCERVFSKAGEVVSKKRKRLGPSTVEKILLLNKNQ